MAPRTMAVITGQIGFQGNKYSIENDMKLSFGFRTETVVSR